MTPIAGLDMATAVSAKAHHDYRRSNISVCNASEIKLLYFWIMFKLSPLAMAKRVYCQRLFERIGSVRFAEPFDCDESMDLLQIQSTRSKSKSPIRLGCRV